MERSPSQRFSHGGCRLPSVPQQRCGQVFRFHRDERGKLTGHAIVRIGWQPRAGNGRDEQPNQHRNHGDHHKDGLSRTAKGFDPVASRYGVPERGAPHERQGVRGDNTLIHPQLDPNACAVHHPDGI